jgi:ABC-type transport system involved in multi-copper enzyme maturation permease subunit
MNTLVIARRELAEKRFVFLTAAGLLLVMPLLSLVHGATEWGSGAFIATVGGVAAIGYTLSLAILLGASVIGRDLSDKRLSFYFAKPVSASSIWFGKVLASLILMVACFLVLMAPVFLLALDAWRSSWNVNLGAMTALVALLSVALFVGSHVISTMARSRSARIVLDGILAFAACAIATLLVRRIYSHDAIDLAIGLAIGMAVATIVALLFSGAWQLERGRADRQRNHIELSKFVWTSVAIVLALGAAFVAWVTLATPRSLTGFRQAVQATNGPWLFVEGGASLRPGYRAKFLVDSNDGTWYRYRPAGQYRLRAAFTADGRHAAYFADAPRTASRLQLYTLDLEGKPEPVDTGITVSPRAGTLVLSDDGSRAAMVEDQTVRVVDLATKRTIGAARIPVANTHMFFVSNDLLRIYSTAYDGGGAAQRATLRIFEFDAVRHALRETTAAPLVAHTIRATVSADGTTMLLGMHEGADGGPSGGARLVLADARTGQPSITIPVARRVEIFGAGLLDGNRIAYVSREADGHGLLHVTGIANPIDLGPLQHGQVLGEPAPGKLVVAAVISGDDGPRRVSESLLVDLARGAVERRETNAGMSLGTFGAIDPRVARRIDPQFVFFRSDSLVRWNALTGETKRLF